MMQCGKSSQLLSLKISDQRHTYSFHYLYTKAVCIKSRLPQLAFAANNPYHIYASHVKHPNSINSNN